MVLGNLLVVTAAILDLMENRTTGSRKADKAVTSAREVLQVTRAVAAKATNAEAVRQKIADPRRI